MESTSSQLKKAEKTVEDFESMDIGLQGSQHPSRQSFSVTPHKNRDRSSLASTKSEISVDDDLQVKVYYYKNRVLFLAAKSAK